MPLTVLALLVGCTPTGETFQAPEPAPRPVTSGVPPASFVGPHGGWVWYLDGTHIEAYANVSGVVFWVLDEQMRPRTLPCRSTGRDMCPRVRVDGVAAAVDVGVDSFVATIPLQPKAEVELAVDMQFDEGLKPWFLRQRIVVGSGPPTEPVLHGGVTRSVHGLPRYAGGTLRDYAIEYLPDPEGRHFWFLDGHGHPEVGMECDHGIVLADRTSKKRDGKLDGSITFPPAADGRRDVEVFLDGGDTPIDLPAP
jgi:hypothetical protein